jgi:hypothetical protein
VSEISPQANWTRLFHIACSLIRQVNADQKIIDVWTFGGGTALMLQINHRESRDIDIFLPDAQLLPFLNPQTREFEFEINPRGYDTDGTRSLKLAFGAFGDIDFIVAPALTSSPAELRTVEGEPVLVESVSEIIVKKIFYRAASLTARDVFDLAAAGEQYEGALIKELRKYPFAVADALATIEKLNADFVNQTILQLTIRSPYREIAKSAIERTRQILRAV